MSTNKLFQIITILITGCHIRLDSKAAFDFVADFYMNTLPRKRMEFVIADI